MPRDIVPSHVIGHQHHNVGRLVLGGADVGEDGGGDHQQKGGHGDDQHDSLGGGIKKAPKSTRFFLSRKKTLGRMTN